MDDELYGEALRLHLYACPGCAWCQEPVGMDEVRRIIHAIDKLPCRHGVPGGCPDDYDC